VSAAPILPAAPPLGAASNRTGGLRDEGTQLIPPPALPADNRKLAPSPLRGALPPTADPVTSRELP
jgi:general secretion pathway protein D